MEVRYTRFDNSGKWSIYTKQRSSETGVCYPSRWTRVQDLSTMCHWFPDRISHRINRGTYNNHKINKSHRTPWQYQQQHSTPSQSGLQNVGSVLDLLCTCWAGLLGERLVNIMVCILGFAFIQMMTTLSLAIRNLTETESNNGEWMTHPPPTFHYVKEVDRDTVHSPYVC